MKHITPGHIPDLLFQVGHDASLHGLPGGGGMLDSDNAMQELTTAYITTMYYSALANQCLQDALPDDIAEVDDRMPRLRIAIERTYADFTLASNWIKNNGGEFVTTSPAKQYYDEVLGMEAGAIRSVETFYSKKS